jgi:transcription initiation factor TFIID subunit 6
MEHAIISSGSIEAIAESIGLLKLSVEAAKALSPDVDYRLREIIQDAQKFARHAKRTRITTEDVSNALQLRNFEV